MEHLFEKIKMHSETSMYPYHMPGHKRQECGALPEEIYQLDITEIDGFDNLHQPEGILKELQEDAARLYGSEESFYLVNGSTCGILAAISTAVPMGGHILITRNCHKSVYHGAYLRNLTISYLYPEYVSEYDICDAIRPEQVQEALEREPEIAAVLIVSPTYEGRIADVKAIAEIVHAKGIPLIVDEAHGAHLGLAKGFAQNSCRCGADIVIHSVHKTLPAMTQTALLHVNGIIINRDVLKRFLRIYQTSSPSYVLMASIDNALRYVQQNTALFCAFIENFINMCNHLSKCKKISCLTDDWKCQDVGKLVVSVKNTGFSGKELYNVLREEYHLQLEMASDTYVLAMFTVNDGPEAYIRMEEALLDMDRRLQALDVASSDIDSSESVSVSCEGQKPNAAISLHVAWDADGEWVPLESAVDKPVAEFVNLYPPGIPLLVPGEYVTAEMINRIQSAVCQNLNVQGVHVVQTVGNAGATDQHWKNVLDKTVEGKSTTPQIRIKIIK